MKRSFWLLVLLVWPAFVLAYTPAQEKFVKGVQAHNEGDCGAGTALLQEAAVEEPEEGLAKFKYKGLNKEDYLPFFYLGRCLEKEGKPQEALAAFRESERQGASLGRSSLAAILRASLRRLEARVSPPTPMQVAVPVVTQPPAIQVPTPVSERPQEAPRLTAGVTVPTRSQVPSAVSADQPTSVSKALRPVLTEGLRLFFLSDYAGAVRTLEPIASRTPLARAFLSYSRAGLFLTGKASQKDLETARRDYDASMRYIDRHAESNWISPAVVRVLVQGSSSSGSGNKN